MFLGLLLAFGSTDYRNSSGETDVALVAAAKRGDTQAFAAIHARYYKRIYRLAYLKTNNASDAEDVASETFMRAISSLAKFNFQASAGATPSLYPWLHRIAVNLIIDTSRQRPPSGMLSLDAPLVDGMRQLLADRVPGQYEAGCPQEVIERREVQDLVRSAIAALPADQGDVLIYRFLGDLSLKEMAPLLNRSEPAVKSLLHRAVVALRGEIQKRLSAIERLEASAKNTATETRKEVRQHVR